MYRISIGGSSLCTKSLTADDHLLAALDGLLEAVGALGDFLLREPRSMASTIPPMRSICVEVVVGAALHDLS